jgi:hypothetical protein
LRYAADQHYTISNNAAMCGLLLLLMLLLLVLPLQLLSAILLQLAS